MLRAAALPLDLVRRADPAEARGLPARGSVQRGDRARGRVRRPDLGVSVGKVKTIDLSDEGKAVATLEIDSQYAPLPDNTKAILRQKTLLGETYVELTPGGPGEPDSSDAASAQTATTDTSTDSGGFIPEGGTLPELQVSDAVQLDEIFRAFDEPTRTGVPALDAGGLGRVAGAAAPTSTPRSATSTPFATEGNELLTILDSQRLATRQFVRNTGEVFEALSERKGQLQGLIRNTNTVFSDDGAAQPGPPGGIRRPADLPRRVAADADAARAVRQRHRPARPAAAPRGRRS